MLNLKDAPSLTDEKKVIAFKLHDEYAQILEKLKNLNIETNKMFG